MKNLLLVALINIFLSSCGKDCLDCKYSTLKGTEIERFCSSTKQDRIDFEAYMDSTATAQGSKAICTKEKY